MKTLILLALVLYWCWAGHGGSATVGATVHTLTSALGATVHAAHLCGAPPAHLHPGALPLPVGQGRAVLLWSGSHWN